MASASWSTLLLAAALLCAMQQASAHCGSLHNWTWSTPDHANYPRIQLAIAKGFKFYNASTASSYLPAALPFYPPSPAVIVNGTVSVWEFLDTSCAETMTLSVNLKFTSPNGKPLPTGTKVYIYGFTGSCATGVQDLYRNNVTQGDDRCNLVWAGREDNFIGAQGSLVGSAPNIFFPRQNATSAGAALTSILIATPPSLGPLVCADLVWDKYDLAAWKKKVAACKPGQGTGRRLKRKLAL